MTETPMSTSDFPRHEVTPSAQDFIEAPEMRVGVNVGPTQ